MCLDDKGVRDLIPGLSRRLITYGRHADADYRLENYRSEGLLSHFDLLRPNSDTPLSLTIGMPGLHNALNAAGAAALCAELDIPEEAIVRGLAEFEGVGRRFTDMGAIQWRGGSARVIDDYGHHPTEVAVTLQAARDAFVGQRVVMVYQPHRFTRTRDHFDEFVSVLGEAQLLILLDVYPAGEAKIEGADAQALAKAIRSRGVLEPIVVSDQKQLAAVLGGVLQDHDVLLMQGAGDIGRLAAALAESESLEELQ
jgi:UDP-N-acetylmuramate--alanine ligase